MNAAVTLQRPLLVKGEPGTGKTELARLVALALVLPLIEWHVKSTTGAVQDLYECDAVSRLRDSQPGNVRAREVSKHIMPGKLWQGFAALGRTDLLKLAARESVKGPGIRRGRGRRASPIVAGCNRG